MSRPQISKLQTWKRHEEKIIEYLKQSLLNINKSKLLKANERKINRTLLLKLRELVAKDELTPYVIMLDAPNQPTEEDSNEEIERKIPDIQFFWNDQFELDPNYRQKSFTIECKRLGKPLRNGNVLTEEYVINGIQRFIKENYGYGRHTPTGAMVGYIQNLDIDSIFKEVNIKILSLKITPLIRESNWDETGVNLMKQTMERAEIIPHQFKLYHLWADFSK